MQVEVRDGLTSMFSIIDHDSEPVLTQAFLLSDEGDSAEEMSEKILIGWFRLPNPDNKIFRN
jgi:hypothetical protein